MNIDEILAKHSRNYKNGIECEREEYALISGSEVKAAIKEIIEETLRMASESAGVHQMMHQPFLNAKIVVNKQSILDVIKQITI